MTYLPEQNPYGQPPYGGQSPYGSGFRQFPAPSHGRGGGNGLAMASMICGIVPWVLCCGGAVVRFLFVGAAMGGDVEHESAGLTAGTGLFGVALQIVQTLLAVAATICGGVALGKRLPGKGFAIAGTVLGGVYLLMCVGGLILGLIAGAALLSSFH